MNSTGNKKSFVRLNRLPIRFSMRTMLLGVAAVCVFLSWIVYTHNREQRFIAKLAELGYDGPQVRGRWSPTMETLLRGTPFAQGPLRSVEQLSFYPSAARVRDDNLKYLPGFSGLRVLCLADTRVTDAGLTQLEGLMELGMLDLQGTDISDDGLVSLRGLHQLDYLNLNNTHITDAGLKHLQELENLQCVLLSGTKVTARGIEELQLALPYCEIEPSMPNRTQPQSRKPSD